jgi:hypothetical protein
LADTVLLEEPVPGARVGIERLLAPGGPQCLPRPSHFIYWLPLVDVSRSSSCRAALGASPDPSILSRARWRDQWRASHACNRSARATRPHPWLAKVLTSGRRYRARERPASVGHPILKSQGYACLRELPTPELPRIPVLRLSERVCWVVVRYSIARMRKRYPTDLSDAQGACIEPYIPTPKASGRPRVHTLRELLNAIFYIVASGCAWRLLAHEFPPWKSVHHHYYY